MYPYNTVLSIHVRPNPDPINSQHHWMLREQGGWSELGGASQGHVPFGMATDHRSPCMPVETHPVFRNGQPQGFQVPSHGSIRLFSLFHVDCTAIASSQLAIYGGKKRGDN